MNTPPIDDAALIDVAVDTITAAGVAATDDDIPPHAGWSGTAGQSDYVPWCRLQRFGGRVDGTLDPYRESTVTVQVSAFGATRRQAEAVRSRTRPAIVGLRGQTLEGARIIHVDGARELPTTRDDDDHPPLWHAPDRWTVWIVPDESA